ncbi:6523_t:CDS:2, partial [Dentiscutata heterogama]
MEYSNVECIICAEKKPIKYFPEITENCKHNSEICAECINIHIEKNLNNILEIKCPSYECDETLDHNDIRKLATEKLYESMSDIRFCLNSKCDSAQVHSGEHDLPIMTCPKCGSKACFTHDVPWHEGLTCSEYDQRKNNEQEVATHNYLLKETKPCPNCGVHIIKNGGCDHMTCKMPECKYEFCW